GGDDGRGAVVGVSADGGLKGVRRAVHEVGPAAPVHVHVDVARRGVSAARVDDSAAEGRQLGFTTQGNDSPVAHVQRAAGQNPGGQHQVCVDQTPLAG